jgi:hypothetical protein
MNGFDEEAPEISASNLKMGHFTINSTECLALVIPGHFLLNILSFGTHFSAFLFQFL